jgi:hypothetical protein
MRKLRVSQVYVHVGIEFPFSHLAQRFLERELLEVMDVSLFDKRYGSDFHIVLNVSAEQATRTPRIAGPAVFRRTKDVEYTIFIPFDVVVDSDEPCFTAAELLLEGAESAFRHAGISCPGLPSERQRIAREVCSNPSLAGDWREISLRGRCISGLFRETGERNRVVVVVPPTAFWKPRSVALC